MGHEEAVKTSRERQIAMDIREEFCRRVIPSHLIVHLTCLQQPDEEKVLRIEDNKGPWYGALELITILQRRSDWISDLIKALKNPSVGLVDFGEKLDILCRQIKVIVDIPEHRANAGNTGTEHDESSDGGNGEEVECVDGVHCHPTPKPASSHDGSKARAEVVYRIHEIILGDITSEEQLPEALALAESYIFKIDKIAQKCIEITFRMETNKKLDAFWKLYQTGGLKAALIRDILTPQKRRLMKKEAEIAGIHISIDVSICEDNYLFVKDFLQSREDPILAKSTVESIILHGEGQHLSQHVRNEALKKFRASLPHELEKAFDDPFIQDKIPEYFVHLVDLGPGDAVRTFYQMVVEKLQEIKLPNIQDEAESVNAVIFALSLTNNEYNCTVENGNVKLTSNGSALRQFSLAKQYLDQMSVPKTANGNTIEIISDLVLTYIEVNLLCHLPATSDLFQRFREEIKLIMNRKHFTLVAGFIFEPIKVLWLLKLLNKESTLTQYLVYRSLLGREIHNELFDEVSILQINDTKEMPDTLQYLAREGFELRFFINVPSGTRIAQNTEELPSVVETVSSASANKHIKVMINKGSDELTDCVEILISRSLFQGEYRRQGEVDLQELYTTRLEIPGSMKNPLTLVVAIAKMINLLGAGKLKLKPKYRIDEEDVPDRYDLSFRILPSRLFERSIPNLLAQNEAQSRQSFSETKTTETGVSEDDVVYEKSTESDSSMTGSLDIDLTSYPLGKQEGDVESLQLTFQAGLQVSEMDLNKTCITAPLVARLCRAGITTNITRLILSGNALFENKEDVEGIGIEFLSELEMLEMRDCKLGDNGAAQIGLSLQQLRKLRSIDFSKNDITETGLINLCRSLRENRGLRAVRLHENSKYGPDGGLILRSFLEDLVHLEIVNVCFCGLGDKGLVHLALAMKSKKMRKINIRQNNITHKGSQKFFEIMSGSSNLNHLEYGNNEIGGFSSLDDSPTPYVAYITPNDRPFLEMMKSNVNLEYVGLWKCGVGSTSFLENDDVLSRFSLLTEFVLQSNDLQPNHAAILGRCLKNLKNIQILMLRDNNIGPKGASDLTKGIAEAPTLREIILDRNKITDTDVLEKLIEVSTKNLPDLAKLDISYNVEMLDVTSESGKYKHLIDIAGKGLFKPKTEREDLQTKVIGWLKLSSNVRDQHRSSKKSKPTLIVM